MNRLKASEPMQTEKSLPSRVVVVALVFGAVALVSACSIDPTDGIRSGPSGGLGVECVCGNGQPDCDGIQGQCQGGLDCRRTDNGRNICTRDCGSNPVTGACPANFICKALGVPGTRLACHASP